MNITKQRLLFLFTLLRTLEDVDAPPKKRLTIDCKSTCPDGMAKLERLSYACGYCNGTEYFEYEDCTCVSLAEQYPDLEYCPPLGNHTLNPVVNKDKAMLCAKEKCVYDANKQSWICCDNPDDEDPACQAQPSSSPSEVIPTTQPDLEVTTYRMKSEFSTQTVNNNERSTPYLSSTTGPTTLADQDGVNDELNKTHGHMGFIAGSLSTVIVVAIVAIACYCCRNNKCHFSYDNEQPNPGDLDDHVLEENGIETNQRNGLLEANRNATHAGQPSSDTVQSTPSSSTSRQEPSDVSEVNSNHIDVNKRESHGYPKHNGLEENGVASDQNGLLEANRNTTYAGQSSSNTVQYTPSSSTSRQKPSDVSEVNSDHIDVNTSEYRGDLENNVLEENGVASDQNGLLEASINATHAGEQSSNSAQSTPSSSTSTSTGEAFDASEVDSSHNSNGIEFADNISHGSAPDRRHSSSDEDAKENDSLINGIGQGGTTT